MMVGREIVCMGRNWGNLRIFARVGRLRKVTMSLVRGGGKAEQSSDASGDFGVLVGCEW